MPTTKLRYVNVESVLLGNQNLLFPDGGFLPPYDNAVGDTKVGPADPTDYAAASIEANDKGLARQIMSGTSESVYERHDQAIGRVTAITMREGFRWETPRYADGGNVVEAISPVPGQTLMLQPYLADNADNWKLTNVAQGADTTRWHYAKIVAVGTSKLTIEAVDPFTIVVPAE